MKQLFHEIKINTNGQGFYDFTSQTISWVEKQKISNGMLNINILHNWKFVYCELYLYTSLEIRFTVLLNIIKYV